MERTPSPAPIAADALAETLHLLRLTGTLYCRSELTAPWAIDMPPIEGCMMFHIVTTGHAWLTVGDAEPLRLQAGSLTLIPHGAGHRICSGEVDRPIGLFDIPVERISERYEVLRYGGGGEFTHAMCGVVRFDHVAAHRLIGHLPRVLQIDSWNEDDAHWLQSTLRFISREAATLRPGGETVITRLADILIIQALRAWLDAAPEAKLGWLAALRNPQIGKALALMHRSPAHPWTVDMLAGAVAMSRSAFSARFTALVGEPALQYLTQWRMQLARAHLQENAEPLSHVAARFGYQSEPAFCRAFKRTFGVAPGGVRRQATRWQVQADSAME
ncbi:MAG: AraC family transcriptional regulator [Acidovorax sp.]|nr:AraC family transcriptional regulator [Acidovorax sp.]